MKLKDGFITHEGAGEHILQFSAGSVSFSGMIKKQSDSRLYCGMSEGRNNRR